MGTRMMGAGGGSVAVQRRLPWSGETVDQEAGLTREWLVTNGLGGFASGTVSGVVTRRYHGLLVAALPAPLGRCVMLSHMQERLLLPDREPVDLTDQEARGRRVCQPGIPYLTEFRLDLGLPVWRYQIGDVVLEKTILLPHMQNTLHLGYRLLQGEGEIQLELKPSVHFRPLEAAVDESFVDEYRLTVCNDCFELSGGQFPPLMLKTYGGQTSFTIDRRRRDDILFRMEESRGYASIGEHWSPGFFTFRLGVAEEVTLVASTENAEVFASLNPEQARISEQGRRRRLLEIAHPAVQQGMAAELVLAADQFIITPAGRAEEAARARALGEEVKTVIAGYHWFTDWGRDTMISLEGLTLTTGRQREASYILRTFANYVRDGLIPNMFPEHGKEGLYHTADASLWFFHAVNRYLQATGDRETLRVILPKLREIVDHHRRGTRFNIGVDPQDGLLRQGQEGYQLTWMDAKVQDWVVTPRRGKAVELNALWYNALCLLTHWLDEENDPSHAADLRQLATQARQSFQEKFWYEAGGYLYDVIDGEQGNDPACRPNQIFAISLDNPILDQGRWQSVLEVVKKSLLTPYGLRSLASNHPDYKSNYDGDLFMRDAAYHQGTVWGWLIGPFIDAWLKVHPQDQEGARQLLRDFDSHLNEAGVGSISEIFDAEPPYTPRGCIAQAWSVAEVLRCWAKCAGRGK